MLELGCGAGRILGYLLELGAQANGIDISPRMVAYCHERYPAATVVTGDMTNLPPIFDGEYIRRDDEARQLGTSWSSASISKDVP